MIRCMRRIAGVCVILLALAAGGVIVGLSIAGGAGTPITKPDAAAFARAVNLQAGDLPGFAPFVREGPPPDGSPPDAAEIQESQESALRCGHRGKPRARAIDAAGSLLVDRFEEGVGSVVVVMPSEALAKAEIATLASRSGRRCLAHGLPGPRSAVYAIKVTFAPVASALGQEAVDIHVLATLQRSRLRRRRFGKHSFPAPVKIDYSIGAIFRVGVADIVFFALSARRQFPDAATERRLLSLLYNRANAHKL
jgi:hypothetical protein